MTGYVKLISIAAVLGAVFWSAWSWRSSIAQTEVREAVDSAVVKKVEEIQGKLDEERANRVEYQERSSAALRALLGDVQRLQKVRSDVGRTVAKDVSDNAVFYGQPLPPGGRQAWINAREAASAAPPASSASSP